MQSEQLTPQEIEEYYVLKQKQAELERRIREIEQKKLLSGTHISLRSYTNTYILELMLVFHLVLQGLNTGLLSILSLK